MTEGPPKSAVDAAFQALMGRHTWDHPQWLMDDARCATEAAWPYIVAADRRFIATMIRQFIDGDLAQKVADAIEALGGGAA